MFSEFPDLASLVSSFEGSDDLGSYPGTSPDASSPSLLSSSEDRAELTSVSESSDDLTSGKTSDLNPLSQLVSHESGSSSSEDESLHDSWSHVPANSSGLVRFLPDPASVSSLSERSNSSGALPPSEPLARSPLSLSSLSLSASLSLSHPGSDDFAPGTRFELSSHGASGPSSVSSGPGGAGSVSSVPSLDDSGSSEVPGSSLASSPGSVTSLVNGAHSVVFLESSDDSDSSSSAHASGPLSVSLLGDSAAQSSSVLESSDDSSSHVSADLLLLSSESVDFAVVVFVSERSDQLSS